MYPDSVSFHIAQSDGCRVEVLPVNENGPVKLYRVHAVFDKPSKEPLPEIVCFLPADSQVGYWSPDPRLAHNIPPDWNSRFANSRYTMHTPVVAVTRYDGSAYVTAAHGDPECFSAMTVGLEEDNGYLRVTFHFRLNAVDLITEYENLIRLDFSGKPLVDSVGDASAWIDNDLGYTPAEVPEAARDPLYSTWYSFHHEVDTESLVKECEMASALGMKTIIIDDGWQHPAGWGYCLYWNLNTKKIPDMRELVERIHALGMKVMLWFAVPFCGLPGGEVSPFSPQSLRNSFGHLPTFDFRYPEHRQHLLDILRDRATAWNLDGLKLDFIDQLFTDKDTKPYSEGMDCASFEEGMTRFFSELYRELNEVKPGFLFEFRQDYTGPAMRRYGNMLRATDCAYDALFNRRAILDLRMTSGLTAVHSDMIMWRADDTSESVAQQLIAALFGVPQISVRLENIPAEHTEILRHWVDFMSSHRALLQTGHLSVKNPELDRSQVSSELGGERVTVNYAPVTVDASGCDTLYVVNATSESSVVLVGAAGRRVTVCIKDLAGRTLSEEEVTLSDASFFPVPPCGLLTLKA